MGLWGEDPCNRKGRRFLGERAVTVSHVKKDIGAESWIAGLFIQPVEYGFKCGAASTVELVAPKVGLGILIILVNAVDLGIALDEGEAALGKAAKLVDLAKYLAQNLCGHGTGGVDCDNDMAGTGAAQAWKIETAPDMLFTGGEKTVVIPAQAGKQTCQEGLPWEPAAIGLIDFLVKVAWKHAAEPGDLLPEIDGHYFADTLAFKGGWGFTIHFTQGPETLGNGPGGKMAVKRPLGLGIVLLFIGTHEILIDLLGSFTLEPRVMKSVPGHLQSKFGEHEIGRIIDGNIPEPGISALPSINVPEKAVHDLVCQDEALAGPIIFLQPGGVVEDMVPVCCHDRAG